MTAPMPDTMITREKVELKPCPFCGAEPYDAPQRNGKLDYQVWCDGCEAMGPLKRGEDAAIDAWNRRATFASSGDHAELARLAEAVSEFDLEWYELRDCVAAPGGGMSPVMVAKVPDDTRRAFIVAANPATVLAIIAEVAALRGERDQIAGESIWWKGVVGDVSHQPSGEVRSIKHLHPAMVRPIYEAHKGTAVADVIAGLIFSLAINQNREQFLVAHANDRATEAERKLAEAVGLLREANRELEEMEGGLEVSDRINTFLSKEAERG